MKTKRLTAVREKFIGVVCRLRPEERCAVLEVTQDELVMLAENEWRLHGNDEAGGGQQWHMPRQTLDMVRQPSFCRGNTNDHSRTFWGPNMFLRENLK